MGSNRKRKALSLEDGQITLTQHVRVWNELQAGVDSPNGEEDKSTELTPGPERLQLVPYHDTSSSGMSDFIESPGACTKNKGVQVSLDAELEPPSIRETRVLRELAYTKKKLREAQRANNELGLQLRAKAVSQSQWLHERHKAISLIDGLVASLVS